MINEIRSYSIQCSRQIADDCAGTVRLQSFGPDEEPRSITAATDEFRMRGWTLHTDGRASCPACMERWTSTPSTEESADG